MYLQVMFPIYYIYNIGKIYPHPSNDDHFKGKLLKDLHSTGTGCLEITTINTEMINILTSIQTIIINSTTIKTNISFPFTSILRCPLH